MTEVTIPDGMPTLSAGAHKPGDGKACLMEYVALLAGESWTDLPSCTNYVLAKTAQRVNDALPDSERHLLVPLIGRLFGAGVQSREVNVGLARWAAEDAGRSADAADAYAANANAYAAAAADAAANAANAYASAANAANTNADANADADAAANAYASAAANAYAAANAANTNAANAYVDFLSRLIDEYDRLTGRTTTPALADTVLADLTQQVTA